MGHTVKLTITPDAGYMFESVTVDGQDAASYVDEGDENSYIYRFVMPGHDVNVSAVFAVRYKITYELDGGRFEGVRYLSYLASTETFTLTEPTREGYTFAGWNTESDGTGTSYNDGQEVSNLAGESGGEVTLYAQWTAITYTITYSGLDGATITATITEGSTGNREYTATWRKKGFTPKESDTPEFVYHSLILSGQIGVIFHVYAPAGASENDYCVYFDVSGDNQTLTHDYTANDYLLSLISDTTQPDDVIELGEAIKDFGSYVQPVLADENH